LGIRDSVVTILGLSFLENSGDTRNSPSITVGDELVRRGAKVRFHDPYADYPDVEVFRSLDDALRGADCAVLLTAHKEYKKMDFARLGELMKNKIFVDSRNQYEKEEILKNGFVFRGLGKA
jgi:UDP-N-acetyl-D-mannosaminuronate dehydrogenase